VRTNNCNTIVSSDAFVMFKVRSCEIHFYFASWSSLNCSDENHCLLAYKKPRIQTYIIVCGTCPVAMVPFCSDDNASIVDDIVFT